MIDEIWEIDDGPKPIEGLDEYGRPDPEYARALGLLPARAGMRVLATLVEAVLALILAVPATIVLVPIALSIAEGEFDVTTFVQRGDLVWIIVAAASSNVLITVYTVVQLVLHGRKGVTLGKAIFGIRSVNARTLERPKFWRGAVVRYLIAGVSFVVPFLGPLIVIAFSPLFDARRRGWPDLVADTWFVDSRRGLDPYDEKRMRIARKRLTAQLHGEKAPLPSLATVVGHAPPQGGYVPTGRFSGGVLGANRSAAQDAPATPAAQVPNAAPAPTPVPPADAQPVAPRPPVPVPTGSGMITAVPSLSPAAPAPAESEAPNASAPARHDPDPAPPAESDARSATPDLTGGEPPADAAAASDLEEPRPTDAPTASPPSVRAFVVLDTGERIAVRTTVLLGRAPQTADGEGAAQLVPVDDEGRSVSKTHLAIMPSRRGLIAVDRGSTNGSALLRDGEETPLVPAQPQLLRAGDSVRFGDRLLRIEAA